jgi:hypothetical protein
MNRDEHVKLLTQTAATLLSGSQFPVPGLVQKAVESAAKIIDESIKVAKSYEETGGLYEDVDQDGVEILQTKE